MVTIIEDRIKSYIEQILRFLWFNYKRSEQATVFGNAYVGKGFDWATSPQNCTINNVLVSVNTNCTTFESVIETLNLALKTAKIKDVYFNGFNGLVFLQTDTQKSVKQISVAEGNGLLQTLGMESGTFTVPTNYIAYTYLYQMFFGRKVDEYDYLDMVVKLLDNTFKPNANNDRKLWVFTDFNTQTRNIPQIVISLSSENANKNELGFLDAPSTADYSMTYKVRRYTANYALHIYSNSKNDCAVIYTLLKIVFEAFPQCYEAFGLYNVALSGGDLNTEIEAENMFTKVLRLNFDYEYRVPSFIDRNYTIEKTYFRFLKL